MENWNGAALETLLPGSSDLEKRPFWMLTLAQCAPRRKRISQRGTNCGSCSSCSSLDYETWFAKSVPSLRASGGKVILALFGAKTISPCQGAFPRFDAVTVVEFPDVFAFQLMRAKYEYVRRGPSPAMLSHVYVMDAKNSLFGHLTKQRFPLPVNITPDTSVPNMPTRNELKLSHSHSSRNPIRCMKYSLTEMNFQNPGEILKLHDDYGGTAVEDNSFTCGFNDLPLSLKLFLPLGHDTGIDGDTSIKSISGNFRHGFVEMANKESHVLVCPENAYSIGLRASL